MAASRSTRVTRSTVGLNGLDENFCGRTLRNRSIAHPDEVIPPALLRSRFPKKRPEPAQIQKGSLGKGGEVKQPGPREPWVSPRKRGLSISEKDGCDKDIVENSDKKSSGALSPVLKKIKRYLRSEEPSSPEEEVPGSFHKEPSGRRNSESDHETDTARSKQANRYILLDDSNQREIKTDPDSEEIVKKSLPDGDVFNHQIVNGIDNNETAAVNCNNCPSDGSVKQNNASTVTSPKELNLSENGSSLTPRCTPANSETDSLSDHNVPCTHSEEQAGKQDHELNNCLPIDHVNQTNESAGVSCADALLMIRDSEEELDVVGDGVSKEQAAHSSNSVPNPNQDKPVCGEDFPMSEVAKGSSLELCSSDTQEHRYTLRTSPRKVVSVKDSSSKNASPCGENGQAEESSNEGSSRLSSAVNGSVATADEAAPSDKKQTCPSAKCSQDKPAARASSSTGYAALPAKESGSVQPAEEEEDEPDVYFFESDHVALKHNKDYQRLLQTISVLEAQRSQSVLDVENLADRQKDALIDPIGFVEKLQKKMDIGIPRTQRIVQLPEISWDQYTLALGNFEREFRNRKRNSRRVKLIFDKAGLHANSQRTGEKDGEPSCYSVLPQSDDQECSVINMSQVRGRLCVDSKAGTFNQLWTVEEQKKLEQLLLKFPPEEVESKRWQKIADELGNRTAKQVASRVQKYFIKLTKAGIPVPGRTPNLYMYSKKPPSKRQHVLNKHLFKPSTFMTSHEPPVFMEEDDDHSSYRDLDAAADEDDEVSDEESIPAACRGLQEYKELLELKKLKKQRLQDMEADSGFVQHVGFKCDNCRTEPIQGIRWHCQDCPAQMSVDFCDSCSDCLYETETHKEDHHLEPVYKAETFLDRDYCMPHGTSYNYLDPNYFPANR
ncbi:PREDICTED: ZZ-type zinc finger-containing protein 3 [Nanorana parkeri]|uniref:ZZ-type zinc finger-containing protein 3 n=1 Tax=Nanorana parkeri TaxID=125878 RepID=UPI0008546136|nr:PREDICTED: ZZ-type zinc finger-containing protein 3 [Nanorana parkeri]XP_018415383.1 PREDICTED: ZZ-type zinc finger-containing protein 3 [Nanorana parkeri]